MQSRYSMIPKGSRIYGMANEYGFNLKSQAALTSKKKVRGRTLYSVGEAMLPSAADGAESPNHTLTSKIINF